MTSKAGAQAMYNLAQCSRLSEVAGSLVALILAKTLELRGLGAENRARTRSSYGNFGDVVDGARQRHLMCQDGSVPKEVIELTKQNQDIFTGNAFIRHQNRPFAFYHRIALCLRFFTRHFFRSIYILKRAGVRYLDVVDSVSQVSVSEYGGAFREFVRNLELPGELRTTVWSALRYDEAIEELRLTDVQAETDNIYTPAPRTVGGKYRLLDLDCQIDRVFADIPRLDLINERMVPASYLLHLSSNFDVATISLAPWQRALWFSLEVKEPEAFQERIRIVRDLQKETGLDKTEVESAITEVTTFFRSLRSEIYAAE